MYFDYLCLTHRTAHTLSRVENLFKNERNKLSAAQNTIQITHASRANCLTQNFYDDYLCTYSIIVDMTAFVVTSGGRKAQLTDVSPQK